LVPPGGDIDPQDEINRDARNAMRRTLQRAAIERPLV